jgi:flagellar hook-length control protein FliK
MAASGTGGASEFEDGGSSRESSGSLFADRFGLPREGKPLAADSVATLGSFHLRDPQSLGTPALDRPVQTGESDAAATLPQQVVRAVHLQWRQGVGEARLQLHPEHLGQLTVTLRVEGGMVSAVLRTESRLALERIEANQHELRTALEQLGLRLDQFVVGIDPDARGRRQPPEAPWSSRRSGRPAQGQPEFDLGAAASSWRHPQG